MDSRFYKNKYLIAIYDRDDDLVGLFDNVKDFATRYNFKYEYAFQKLRRVIKGKRKKFYYKNTSYTITLIPLDPKEIEELLEVKHRKE